MEEYFDVVDENDNVTGKATRSECHSNPDLIHRGVHIWIENDEGRLLLQKRSMEKDLYKGMWIDSASGHVESEQEYEEAAHRELMEELGIETDLKRIGKIFHKGIETEFIMIFRGKHNGPFKCPKEEIDYVRFFTIDEIKKMMETHPEDFCPVTLASFRKLLSD
jgi:isopentenyl-diphosphate delta-isomerase type 1